MARRSLQWWLLKVNRISGYILFPVILAFIISGFGITGRYGFDRLMSYETGWQIHRLLLWPVIGLFVIHSLISWYFSFRRWGWVR
jgi:sorbitol-specific phosphotransferase system component IIC